MKKNSLTFTVSSRKPQTHSTLVNNFPKEQQVRNEILHDHALQTHTLTPNPQTVQRECSPKVLCVSSNQSER